MKTPLDLEAIDRELDALGKPRPDIAELVERYVAIRRDSDPPAMRIRESSEPPHAPPRSHPSEAGAWSAVGAHAVLGSQDLSEDHDEFELLVDDAELSELDDEQFETA